MAPLIGTSVLRKEDPPLLTGRCQYVDDIRLSGMAAMAYVRSQVAHDKIVATDVD